MVVNQRSIVQFSQHTISQGALDMNRVNYNNGCKTLASTQILPMTRPIKCQWMFQNPKSHISNKSATPSSLKVIQASPNNILYNQKIKRPCKLQMPISQPQLTRLQCCKLQCTHKRIKELFVGRFFINIQLYTKCRQNIRPLRLVPQCFSLKSRFFLQCFLLVELVIVGTANLTRRSSAAEGNSCLAPNDSR